MKNSALKKMIKGGQKEDHLAPTKIEEPKPVKRSERTENLSHKETLNNFDVYGRIGHLMHQHNVTQDIKERYQSTVNKAREIYTKQDINYSAGRRSGLPHMPYETMKNAREMQDQDFRDVVAKEAKQRYKEGENLTKRFREQQPTPKELRQEFRQSKSKGMDRER